MIDQEWVRFVKYDRQMEKLTSMGYKEIVLLNENLNECGKYYLDEVKDIERILKCFYDSAFKAKKGLYLLEFLGIYYKNKKIFLIMRKPEIGERQKRDCLLEILAEAIIEFYDYFDFIEEYALSFLKKLTAVTFKHIVSFEKFNKSFCRIGKWHFIVEEQRIENLEDILLIFYEKGKKIFKNKLFRKKGSKVALYVFDVDFFDNGVGNNTRAEMKYYIKIEEREEGEKKLGDIFVLSEKNIEKMKHASEFLMKKYNKIQRKFVSLYKMLRLIDKQVVKEFLSVSFKSEKFKQKLNEKKWLKRGLKK